MLRLGTVRCVAVAVAVITVGAVAPQRGTVVPSLVSLGVCAPDRVALLPRSVPPWSSALYPLAERAVIPMLVLILGTGVRIPRVGSGCSIAGTLDRLRVPAPCFFLVLSRRSAPHRKRGRAALSVGYLGQAGPAMPER